ncbi:MAG: cell division protein FtsQ/DivIB [Chloroflexi bacterium]|nr:cell division protein FtsQ/DivIB [Chloroflexota bacterium]MCY3958794.1 cell division protein FtsQ/DivIB [Chloroflexota bacterium]
MTEVHASLFTKVLSLLIAGFTAGLLIWLLNSPVFNVRDVVVHRADSSPPPAVDPAAIEKAARPLVGMNAFRIDAAALQRAIRDIPGVADALVHVRIDGRATVTVAYEAPVANWIVNGQSYLVNASGEVLAEQFEPGIPLTIEDDSPTGLASGALVNVGALYAAHQLQSNLPLLRVIPSRIHYSAGRLTVVDHAGRELDFGDTLHLDAKLMALHAVLEQANRLGERIASVDLRPVERPTYRTVDAPPLAKSRELQEP